MKRRFFKSRPKSLPKGYDSQLEYRLHQTSLQEAQHHPPKEYLIDYLIEHKYEPDFYFEVGSTMYVIEVKGRFRDSTEASKYVWIRKYLNDWKYFKESSCTHIEMLVIFENSLTVFPFAKARKDGTKRNHADWANSNNFKFLCEKSGDLEGVSTVEELLKRYEDKYEQLQSR